MSGPAYHGRTHLPGGTDPIPGLLANSLTGDTNEAVILATVPGAYYKLDEASGDWADSSGNAHTMTYVSRGTTTRAVGSSYDEGDGSLAVSTSGSIPNQSTDVSSVGAVNHSFFLLSGSMTVSFRMRRTGAMWSGGWRGGILGTTSSGSGATTGWCFWSDDPNTVSFIRGQSQASKDEARTGALAINTWYRITGVWDGTTLSIYVNDTLAASSAPGAPISISGGSSTLKIGGTGTFDGIGGRMPGGPVDLDSLILWNRALSPAEVAAIGAGTSPYETSGYVATADGAGGWVWAPPTIEVTY